MKGLGKKLLENSGKAFLTEPDLISGRGKKDKTPGGREVEGIFCAHSIKGGRAFEYSLKVGAIAKCWSTLGESPEVIGAPVKNCNFLLIHFILLITEETYYNKEL